MADFYEPCEFIQALVDEQPNYSQYVVEDMRPRDGEIGHIAIGEFPAFKGVSMFQDRFNHVSPNTTRPWKKVAYESCVGRPCCKKENQIGIGSTRRQFYVEEISYSTPILCFDQQLHVTHAVKQWDYIISDIMKPTAEQVQSMWIRKRLLQWADNKYVCRKDFGYESSRLDVKWAEDANGNEVFMLTTQMPQSGLSPQMLQRRVNPLTLIGYHGKDPFKEEENLPMIELVTGNHTLWDLEHLVGQAGGGGSPTLPSNWRFTQWDATNAFWRYGFTGQIGDYMARVDPFEMRFNYVGLSGDTDYPYKFQLILPLKNIVSSGAGGAMGLKSIPNPDFENAKYRFTRVHHKDGARALVQSTEKINSMMPYAVRDFGGKWKCVLPHVVVDEDGTVTAIDNRRENICQFIMDLEMALEPDHTEWIEWYFHEGGPSCVEEFHPCAPDPCYPSCPEQDYNGKNDPCPEGDASITFTPTLDTGVTPNVYHLEANTVLCDGAPISHGAISSATLAGLVDLLNAQLSALGTWSVEGQSIILTGSTCATVSLPWVFTVV